MKKVANTVLVTVALSLICGKAMMQTTPEAYIKQCPDLPSVANLAAPYENEAAKKAVQTFENNLSTLQNKLEAAIESAKEAEDKANMQDSERIEKQLGANKGSAEKAIAALENKSAEEIVNAALSGNLNLGDLLAGSMDLMSNEGQVEAMMLSAQNPIKMEEISSKWNDTDGLIKKERKEVIAKLNEIREKYEKQIKAVPCTGPSGEMGPTYTKSEEATLNKLMQSEREECFTLWRAHIVKTQERVKSKLTDVPKYDQYLIQMLTASGQTASAKAAMSSGFLVAKQYLEISNSVTSLPVTLSH